jgi:phage tail sheath protein FI
VRNTAQYNTSYAALYYPWVKIYDPIANDGRDVTIPPDGFIAGIYARTDITRNVGKTPAGITDGALRGITGLERILDKGERDILYPARINPLVSSPQTGLAVWGGRTLSKDAEWLYINARRLFMFCEQSVYNASFWVVFENNGPALWSRMTAQGNGFFLRLFRDGYFAGSSPSEAYAIVIDSSNNPKESIDAGFVTADYYIAPNKPAEFVRLRFQQKIR